MYKSKAAVVCVRAVVVFLLLFASTPAGAKPWKAAELGSQQTFKYGAFEARLRAAEGSGMVTAFFLWKYGSEVPGALWQEQDFEIFGRDGNYQTQLMTPGKSGAQRTEHVVDHLLLSPAWTRYYTYRMEWTPSYLAFSVDGQEVRRETDAVEFAKFFDPQAEAAQIRLALWAGDTDWSGSFDASAVPASVFVNWVQTYSYTPGKGPNGSDFTPLWRDDFNSLDTSRWQLSNWTFDAAVNDYIPQNASAKNGGLVEVFTNEQATGKFPTPPADDGSLNPPPGPTGPWPLPYRIEAEDFARYSDTTPGNIGGAYRNTDVDIEAVTSDPTGGQYHVGWTDVGEWLEYDVRVAADATFDLTLRVASLIQNRVFHVEIDGDDATGPLTVPANGWQTFEDLDVPDVFLTAGAHVVRLVFDTPQINVNYFVFSSSGESNVPPACTPTTRTYEAETMSATTGGSAPGGWNLWSNGSLSTTHTFAGGDGIIRVSAYGQSAQGVWPHMIVSVGGKKVGDTSVSATAYAPYEFAYTASPGSATVSVSFDNDYYANGEDRNLIVDSVSIDECLD
jgi:beta-glucanase (GH16 family)